jgi:hypothetical protein
MVVGEWRDIVNTVAGAGEMITHGALLVERTVGGEPDRMIASIRAVPSIVDGAVLR